MNNQTMMRERVRPVLAASAPQLPALAEPNVPPEQVVMVPPEPAPASYPPKMAKAILAVTKAIGGIGKHGYNDFHRYDYQKWDDVLERLSPLLVEHGLIIQQSEVGCSVSDKDALLSITYEFDIINDNGDVWPKHPRWKAIARLCDNKGTYDDKAANKCHTQAHKYFLLHFFKIRTKESVDADSDGNGSPATSRPKPPDPNKPAGGPHAIPIPRGCSYQQFADAYLKAVQTSKTAEEIAEWDRLNDRPLDRLNTGAPDIYNDMNVKVQAHAMLLAQGAQAAVEEVPAEPSAAPPPVAFGWRPSNPNAPERPRAPNPNAPKPPSATEANDPGDIPPSLRRSPDGLKEQLLKLIAETTSRKESLSLARDPDFNKRRGQLSPADGDEIDRAFLRHQEELPSE